VVKFCVLEEGYRKLALAGNDRTIEIHAQYGRHFKLRTPNFIRDMVIYISLYKFHRLI